MAAEKDSGCLCLILLHAGDDVLLAKVNKEIEMSIYKQAEKLNLRKFITIEMSNMWVLS